MENRRGDGNRAGRTVHSKRTGGWGQEDGRQARLSKRIEGVWKGIDKAGAARQD